MDLHWLYPCTWRVDGRCGERAENGAEEAPADWQEKRTVERENAGETYGATEKTGTSTKIRLHLKTGELEIVHERVESEGE